MAIDRRNFNEWKDDDGTTHVGTVLSKTRLARDLLDPIDAALKEAVGSIGTPASHAASHTQHGADPVTVTPEQVTGLGDLLDEKVSTTDARLTDMRVSRPHAQHHAENGRDAIHLSMGQVNGLADALHTVTASLANVSDLMQEKVGTADPRFTDARVPTPHSTTHGAKGQDPILISGLGGYPGDGGVFLNGMGAWAQVSADHLALGTIPHGRFPAVTPWTPTLAGTTSGHNPVAYQARVGLACRFGPFVAVHVEIWLTSLGSLHGHVVVDGLPAQPMTLHAFDIPFFQNVPRTLRMMGVQDPTVSQRMMLYRVPDDGHGGPEPLMAKDLTHTSHFVIDGFFFAK